MGFYSSIFNRLPFPCLLFEKKNGVFVIKKANSFYCKVANINQQDLKGKSIDEAFPENPSSRRGLEKILESFKIAYESNVSHKIDLLRYDLYDQKTETFLLRYWEIENIPIDDKENNTRYILNVVKDITQEVLEREKNIHLQQKLDLKSETHTQFIKRITDGLFSLDRKGNFISVNDGLIEIAETTEKCILEMNFLPFCGKEYRGLIVEKFNAAISGIKQRFEAGFTSAKGTSKILEISLVPLKNADKITGLYGIAKDITRLKNSETALLQSERKFKALVQEGSDLIGILDLEGTYKFVSETSARILGISSQDFIGKSAFDFIHPDDLERVLNEFALLEEKGQIQIEPFRFKNSKEEWRWVETKATNLLHDPAIKGIVTNSRDITDHLNAQKAIRESEERFRSFFEHSKDAIIVAIPEGKILAANPSACKMFQRSEEELCALEQPVMANSKDPRVAEAINLRKEKGMATAELSFIRKDGTEFPGEITSSLFKDSDGNSRSSMIIRDITDRKNAENKLLELNKNLKTYTQELIGANKGLEQFSYIISHNLRAPVANLLGLTELLNDPDYSEETKLNLRQEIQANAQRMDGMMRDLNKVMQVKHNFSEARELIILDEIVDSIRISLQKIIEKDNIILNTDFREVPVIKSVSSFIHSIFYNLIFNSIKFRNPGVETRINIYARSQNGITSFVFEDNGLGVDLIKNRKVEIFGLYKRFHLHVEGKGMGLFMVKTQTDMLGGRIDVSSEPDRGSTFTIEFDDQILKR